MSKSSPSLWWLLPLSMALTVVAQGSSLVNRRAGSGRWWFSLVILVAAAVLGVGWVVHHYRSGDARSVEDR